MVSVYACWASVRWFCSHHFLWLSLRRLLLWCECFIYGLLFQNVWSLGQWLSTGGCLLFSRVSRTSYKCIHNYFQISNFVQEPLFVVVKTIGLPSSSTVNNFVRDGSDNDVVSYWRRLESDCHFRLFSNSWKVIKNTSKDLSNFVEGHGLFGRILAALLSPAKLTAYFFIQNCFKCLQPLQYCCIQQHAINFVTEECAAFVN